MRIDVTWGFSDKENFSKGNRCELIVKRVLLEDIKRILHVEIIAEIVKGTSRDPKASTCK